MSKGLIFLCCACAILIFTIINLSIGPVVSGAVNNVDNNNWGTLNCKYYRDEYDKDDSSGDEKKYGSEWQLNECDRKKGMHDMEYTSFIFNMVIGFVCGLLGLLHLFDVKKEYVSKTGLIGLGCGIVGFIFSFVYVILNGLVFTTVDTGVTKIDSDRQFGELVEKNTAGDKFKCIYYEKGNVHESIAKISDFVKKQYNYEKDLPSDFNDCIPGFGYRQCQENDGFVYYQPATSGDCKYVYFDDEELHEIIYKDIFDRFLTTLLLSLFVCLANIGLAIFGFLLYRTPSEF